MTCKSDPDRVILVPEGECLCKLHPSIVVPAAEDGGA